MPLAPPARRWPWIAGGLLLEAAGLGTIALVMARESRREDSLGEITKYSVRLAWHDALHQPRLLLVVAACVAAYVLGALLVARPFARSRRALIIGVPLAALAGLVVLGVAAFLVWLVWATDGDILNSWGGDWPVDGRARRRKEREPTLTERRAPGGWEGRVWVADDFDDLPPELLDPFEGRAR